MLTRQSAAFIVRIKRKIARINERIIACLLLFCSCDFCLNKAIVRIVQCPNKAKLTIINTATANLIKAQEFSKKSTRFEYKSTKIIKLDFTFILCQFEDYFHIKNQDFCS